MWRVPGLISFFCCWCACALAMAESSHGRQAWKTWSPRPGLMPVMQFDDSTGLLESRSTGRFEMNGAWRRDYPAEGGQFYRVAAECSAESVRLPRRSIVVRVDWKGVSGRRVGYPDFPSAVVGQAAGWMRFESILAAPPGAATATLELIHRWDEKGSVAWRNVTFEVGERPPARKVRIATVNFRPSGSRSSAENLEKFSSFVTRAAESGADIVCLSEGITVVGTGLSYAEAAEPVPGPTTEFLGHLAAEHGIYVVAGLYEWQGKVLYNTAVLIGPAGELVGRYRKVSLPREEIDGGITPGEAYPVFSTPWGRVGIMICWDSQFPEPARRLAANGAEIIFLPIWGGMEILYPARALENQVFLVSSSYDSLSAIWNRRGERIAEAPAQGSVAVTEVDLSDPVHFEWLGDLRARIAGEAPEAGEASFAGIRR